MNEIHAIKCYLDDLGYHTYTSASGFLCVIHEGNVVYNVVIRVTDGQARLLNQAVDLADPNCFDRIARLLTGARRCITRLT